MACCAVRVSGGRYNIDPDSFLAMGLLRYYLNLSVIPPDCGADADKGKEAQSGNAPYGYRKRYGDVECAKAGKQSNKKQCRNYKFIKFQPFGGLFY